MFLTRLFICSDSRIHTHNSHWDKGQWFDLCVKRIERYLLGEKSENSKWGAENEILRVGFID